MICSECLDNTSIGVCHDCHEDAKEQIKELQGCEKYDFNEMSEQMLIRIVKIESALQRCVDDPLFKIHFTMKYHEFKKLLEKI